MMNAYTQHLLKLVVAQICDTVGWHSIQSTPLEILMDLLQRHLTMTGNSLKEYAELFGRTEPNLDDLGLVFQHHKISVPDLEEFVQYVESVPFPGQVPKYPVERESHLNFLKPGSREVLTRPVHVHEYLPPMHPEQEAEEERATVITKHEAEKSVLSTETATNNPQQDGVFKRPCEPTSESPQKRPRISEDDCSARPTREITSVMMTTSGFISPAREGKLPEARSPIIMVDSNNFPIPMPEPSSSEQVLVKEEHKKIKKNSKKEKSRKKTKDIITAIVNSPIIKATESPTSSEKRKKVVSMKEVLKNKALKTGVVKTDSAPFEEPFIDVEEDDDSKPIDFTMENLQRIHPKSLTPLKPYSPPVMPPSTIIPQVIIDSRKGVEDSVEKLPTGISSSNGRQKLSIFKRKYKPMDCSNVVINQNVSTGEPKFVATDAIDRPPLVPAHAFVKSDVEIDVKPVHVKQEIPMEDDLARPGTSSSFAEFNHFRVSSPPPKMEKDREKEKDKKKAKKERSKSRKSKKMFKTPETAPVEESEDSDCVVEETQPVAPPSSFVPPGLNPYLGGMPYSPFANSPFANSPSLIPNPSLFTQLLASSPVNKVFPRFPFPVHSGFSAFGQPPHMSSIPPVPPMGMFLHQSQVEPEPEESQPKPEKQEEIAPPVIPECNVAPLVLPTEEELLEPPKSNPNESADEDAPLEERKKEKEHKKEKKDKEERSKKKKDKKDKVKNKDKEKKRDKGKEKSEKKKEKKEKKREEREMTDGAIPKLTLKLGPVDSSSSRSHTPDSTGSRKITIKPIAPRTEVERTSSPEVSTREPSPELAKISPLCPRSSKSKIPKLSNPVDVPAEPVPSTSASTSSRESRSSRKSTAAELPPLPPPPATKSIDQFGNEVWICPACKRQDDGSPMIGCDDCDAWYHWVCVGIQIPPDTNEDWYCSHCIQRKKQQAMIDNDKKRKRKKSKKAH